MLKYLIIATLVFLNYSVSMSQDIKPCPKSPNCVSSVDNKDDSHYLAAIVYTDTVEQAIAQIKELVLEMPRSHLITETDKYLSFELRSQVFRFVDVLEFYFDDNRIQFSSRAKMGYGDFGVNKRRMLELIQSFQQLQ